MSDDSRERALARVGEILNDKWTLERLLGIGGMGAVYAGLHRNGARAAVKVLHRYLARHEEVRARFLREGYAANRVEHASVVKVLDDDIVKGGADDGTAYLVMELLDGESLEARTSRGLRVSEREFLVIAAVVLDVLGAAHAAGVIHRDIKPDNLFITSAGSGAERVKVLDFGLARLLEGQSTTVYGMALGTPSYMSPEQAAGRNDELDGRTDLFALAASGFRLVTGRKVHEAGNPVELVVKMANVPAPAVRSVAPDVSEAFARVLDKALMFRREDRYETAAAMKVDVLAALAALDATLSPNTMPSATGVDKSVELSASALESFHSVPIVGMPAGDRTWVPTGEASAAGEATVVPTGDGSHAASQDPESTAGEQPTSTIAPIPEDGPATTATPPRDRISSTLVGLPIAPTAPDPRRADGPAPETPPPAARRGEALPTVVSTPAFVQEGDAHPAQVRLPPLGNVEEASLAPTPMHRATMPTVPLAVGAGLLLLVLGGAYVAGRGSDPGPVAPVPSGPPAAIEPLDLEAVEPGADAGGTNEADAATEARDASAPRAHRPPLRRPFGPPKPIKRPKR